MWHLPSDQLATVTVCALATADLGCFGSFDKDASVRTDAFPFWSGHSLAIAVQRQMLPRNPKQLETIKYAGLSRAAEGIGGDYYDFLDFGPGRLALVLADVSGKGVAAALMMANLQASVRGACAYPCNDLIPVLEFVNRQFFESTLPEQYATLFFGRYDDRTRMLDYVNCGHQPALIMRGDRSIERLEATALPLGLFQKWGGEKKTIELRNGDLLCLCSDGIIEAGLETGYEFGEDGLVSVLTSGSDQNVERTIARIAQAASTYAANEPADDMTVVGIRAC